MNNDILVSVIVPVYNVEKYLERCLKSIINQTYSNIEIILINDASTDKSGEICRKFKEEDRRIILIDKEKNEGAAAARNDALKIIKGGYIAFIDADDYVSDKYIEILLGLCLKNDADMAECSFQYGKSDSCEFDNKVSKEEFYSRTEYMHSSHFGYYALWSRIYKAELFEGIEFPAERSIATDAAVIHKVAYRAEKIVYIPNQLYVYFQSGVSIIRSKYRLNKLDAIKSFEERLEFFLEIGEKRIYEHELRIHAARLLKHYYCVKKYYPEEKEILGDLHEKICKTYKLVKNTHEGRKIVKVAAFAGTYAPYLLGRVCYNLVCW